jgi:antitoxin PrlF
MIQELLMAIQAVRIQEKGQVTIPLEIRKKLNLKKGDMVTFVETSSGILILPVELVVSQALDRMGQALKGRGVELDTLMERSREIRGDIIQEQYNLRDTQP